MLWRCCSTVIVASYVCASAAASASGQADSVEFELVGSVEARCAFIAAPGQVDLGAMEPGREIQLGELAFRCNMPDSPNVNLTVQSEHGALRREGGTESIPYSAQWDVAGGGTAVSAANFANPIGFSLAAGDIVAGQRGNFKVKLGGSGNPFAGVYRDRITYTISP